MAVNIAVNMASFIDDLVQHSDKLKKSYFSISWRHTDFFVFIFLNLIIPLTELKTKLALFPGQDCFQSVFNLHKKICIFRNFHNQILYAFKIL